MTREQIENLAVGCIIEETYDTRNGEPLPGARWQMSVVSNITFRGVNDKGEAYVGGYSAKNTYDNIRISFNAKEGDKNIRMYQCKN